VAERTIRCRVVTPTAELIDEPAIYASVPAWDGLFGVIHDRAPIICNLGVGELRIDFPDATHEHGSSRTFYIDGGFARVSNNELTILADTAIPVEQLTVTDAKAELAEAEARVVPPDAKDPAAEVEKIAHEREAARTKLRLAQQVREHGI